MEYGVVFFFFFQAEDGIRDWSVTGVQTCALPIADFKTGAEYNFIGEVAHGFLKLPKKGSIFSL